MSSPVTYQEYLENYHPHAEEFHQAVKEVCDDIAEEYESSDDYAEWNIIERLIEPDRIIKFRVSWEDDKGKVHVNRAWRVQFHNLLGAYKGGLRFHPTVNESVLKFLGFEQCFKNALTGLPMGGAKGGSDFNPKGKSQREIMRFCQSFMRELYRHIGPDTDVPAGDINVSSNEIGFMFGEYLRINNRWEGVLTGKTPGFGGSCGREEATGYGVIYFLREMLQAHDDSLDNKRILISGSGNVALHAAEKAIAEGAVVLTVSDSSGTLYFKDGMTEKELNAIKSLKLDDKGRLKEASVGDYQEDKKPWGIENADIALPCATQNELDDKDAETLLGNEVRILCEGANMPLTDGARKQFLNANALYGPAKAANAGGVAVSGLERCIQHVKKKDGVYPYSRGANIYGFKKLAGAMITHGIG